jgi:hypothetical protein
MALNSLKEQLCEVCSYGVHCCKHEVGILSEVVYYCENAIKALSCTSLL